MTETSTRTPSRSALVWILFATTCCLAGWILSDLTRADAAPPPAAPAGAASAPAATPPPAAAAPAPAPTVVVVTVPPAVGVPAEAAGAAPAVAVVSGTPGGTVAERPAAASGRDRAGDRPSAGGTTTVGRPGADAAPAPALVSSTRLSWLQVVASDGAVVLVGPDGQLVANTGDAFTGGAVVLEPQGSQVTTAARPGSTAPESTVVRTGTGGVRTMAGTPIGDQALMADPRIAAQAAFDHVAFSGYEDHSLRASGNRNLIAYDDANLFVDHVGPVDANTGDTDSSGINAMDVTGSVIRSGASGGVDDEPGEEPEEEESVVDSASGRGASASAPSTPAPASPTSGTSLAVSGDGFDDLSVHASGDDNVISDEDSNLVVGGTGPVAAQVGDADTAGVLVMGVHDSTVTSGCAADVCP